MGSCAMLRLPQRLRWAGNILYSEKDDNFAFYLVDCVSLFGY